MLNVRAGYLTLAAVAALTVPAEAQQGEDERARVLAVAEAALEAITSEDLVAFTDLMLPEAVTFSVREQDGEVRYSPRSRTEWRTTEMERDVVERGFDPEVRIAGSMALVWLPYDLYVDGAWSHCGVDAFTLVRTPDGWRIAALVWTAEQPPACRRHPEGPPGR